MAFKPIQIIINAKDNASAVLGRLEGKVKAVGVTVAAYFGIRAFAGGVKSAAEFEAAMDAVKAATGASAAEMATLGTAVKNAMLEGIKGTDAAAALENFGKAGLSAADAVKALPAAMQLSAAANVDLAAASEFVSKAVMGMGLSFDDAARVADVLALGANATNTSVEGLAQALSYAAPVANSLGVSLESTVAIIGKFADAGIDASRAGTALNSIMSQFADPASKFRQELGRAGIVTNNFEEALQQLAAKGPEGAEAINAVGLEAGPALRALLNQGMGALLELIDKLRRSSGSAKSFADILKDNLSGALGKLSGAWDVASKALQEPVLPVLRKGVDELTAAIRRATDDGTVAKFGQALATAFEQGLKYFQAFAANVNFDAVILRLQVFASETQETLQRIGTYAANAGNTVQAAWGVMTAGTNAILAVVYKVGEAFAGVASNIQSGVAVILQGLSRITFGGVSASFKAAADEMRLSAEATWASSQALAEKSSEAFNAMADGAQMAREGWDGLTASVKPTVPAFKQASNEIELLGEKMRQEAEAAYVAMEAQEKKAESATAAAAATQKLKQEYNDLIQSGNLQEAAKRLLEIDRAQQQLSKSGKDAEEAAKRVDQAYKNLGLKSNAELKAAADEARKSFETLTKDGTQPPQRIAEAWKVMADRVIAANAGIAPSWLKAQAGAQGYEVVVDRAGQATLRLKEATDRSADSHDRAARSIRGHMSELERLNAQKEREIAAQEKANQLKERELELYRQKWGIDKEGYSLNTAGQRQSMSTLSRTAVLQMAKQQGLDDANALRVVDSFGDQYDRKPGLLGGIQGGVSPDAVNKAIADAVLAQSRGKVTASAGAVNLSEPQYSQTRAAAVSAAASQPITAAVPAAPAMSGAQPEVVKVHRHEISIGGRNLVVNAADESSSDALNQFFEQLERGALMAGGVR